MLTEALPGLCRMQAPPNQVNQPPVTAVQSRVHGMCHGNEDVSLDAEKCLRLKPWAPMQLDPRIWNPYMHHIYHLKQRGPTSNPTQTRKKQVRAQVRGPYFESVKITEDLHHRRFIIIASFNKGSSNRGVFHCKVPAELHN